MLALLVFQYLVIADGSRSLPFRTTEKAENTFLIEFNQPPGPCSVLVTNNAKRRHLDTSAMRLSTIELEHTDANITVTIDDEDGGTERALDRTFSIGDVSAGGLSAGASTGSVPMHS